MRRASVVIWLFLLWQVVPVHALDLDDLPAWVRSALSPLGIDWQQFSKESEVQSLPSPFITGGLSPVYDLGYSHGQATPTTGSAAAVPRTVEGSRPLTITPVSAGGTLQGLPKLATGAGLPGVISTPQGTSPLATVHSGGALLPAPVGRTVLPGAVTSGSSPLATATGGTAAELSSLKTVSTPGFTKQLHANPAAAQSLIMTINTLFQNGELDEARLPQWLIEQKVEQPALVQALDQMTLEHPMDPIYLPICKVLWDNIGPDMDEYLKFPYKARIIMGIYLAVLEREEDAEELLASVPEEWQKQDPSVPMYHVSCELNGYQRRGFRLCIWAWKWGARMRGPADRAFVCWHIRQACDALGAPPELVGRELLPWCEEALGLPGSEGRWPYALRELVWAYVRVGRPEAAIERYLYWLDQAKVRGVAADSLWESMFRVVCAYELAGRAPEAVAMLRRCIDQHGADAQVSQMAQAELVKLSSNHPQLTGTEIIAPRFIATYPTHVVLAAREDAQADTSLICVGNAAFRIDSVKSTVPGLRAVIQKHDVGPSRASYTIAVVAAGAPVERSGDITMQTNDARNPSLVVRITLQVRGK